MPTSVYHISDPQKYADQPIFQIPYKLKNFLGKMSLLQKREFAV